MRVLVGGVTVLIATVVLLAGLLPPHVLETGQLGPVAWCWPILLGGVSLVALLRWRLEGWRAAVIVPALLAVIVPPLVLCIAGSMGQGGRLAIWMNPVREVRETGARPVVGIMSGPMLHGPASGGAIAGFVHAPLWEILGRGFETVPLAVLDDGGLERIAALLLVQPRALAPREHDRLDDWIRHGGRAVLLVDPDLRWADGRPLGHPLRPPPVSLLDPLLDHWGLALAPAPHRFGIDPVGRRFLDDGWMIQVAGASHFIPSHPLPSGAPACTLSSGGLVARCAVGKGVAILIADADFANDALWTAEPQAPERTIAWTSDAVPVLADWLVPGAGQGAGRRVWLTRADGLPAAVRMALIAAVLLGGIAAMRTKSKRTKGEL